MSGVGMEWKSLPAAIRLPLRGTHTNYDALYYRKGYDLFRVRFGDWKMEKVKVNLTGIDTTAFFVRTTADGKEMVYKTTVPMCRLGVIEDLFR